METMSKKVIFTTDRGEWHQASALASAPDFLAITMMRTPDPSSLQQALKDADYLISERSGKITRELFRNAPSLKLIQRLGSQYHDIDLEAAQEAGVAVCYLPIQGVILVAEHLVMQMLAIAKKLPEVARVAMEASPDWGKSEHTTEDTFFYNWSSRSGIEMLWERKVGIIGMGEIGIELARRLQGWGCQISYHKRHRLPPAVEQQLGIHYQEPDEIFSEADFLVNLLPYLPGTERFFNHRVFEQMKQGAIVVSCGSGGTIDETALADAVINGKLAGAALDTFEYEPLQSESPLCQAANRGENILLTPHTAAGSPDSGSEMPDRSGDFRNIIHHLNQEPLEYQLV
jgi:phosphoglycerate dehydrogenase-like enzyme